MNSFQWFPEELLALKPREQITVSEFADKNRVLNQFSARPGPWKTDFVEYIREIQDQLNNEDIERIVFLKPTQVAGTQSLINMALYAIVQDPAPIMFVLPDEGACDKVSETDLQPAIKECRLARMKWDQFGSERRLLRFKTGDTYVYFAASSSASQLASRAIKYLFLDEVDKYSSIQREASAISLAIERTKTFPNRKIFITSTPTTDDGNVYVMHSECDQKREFYVPCPHCNHYQTLKFIQLKTLDRQNVRYSSYYQCEECNELWDNHQKNQQVKLGRWDVIEQNPEVKVPRSVGYHINTIYSPFVELGEIMLEWFNVQEGKSDAKNFYNSYLGLPFKEQIAKVEKQMVAEKQVDYPKKYVPEQALGLTAGVDVQKDHFYYVVRAWGNNMTSWLVDYGRAETFQELKRKLLDNPYPVQNSDKTRLVDKICIDSGYRAEEVYNFCLYNYEVCIPTKGISDQMKAERKYRVTSLDNKGKVGLKLYLLDTNRYKDHLFGTIQMPIDEPGTWLVFDNVEEGYMNQITSEHKVKVKNHRTGKVREAWVPYASKANNHYLDCEVYALAAAEIYDYRDIAVVTQALEEHRQQKAIEEEHKPIEEPKEKPKSKEQPRKERFINKKPDNWLKR